MNNIEEKTTLTKAELEAQIAELKDEIAENEKV